MLAFEFRHDSWFDSEIFAALRKYNSTFGVVDAPERDAIREVTGSFIYMRLRKGDYTAEELNSWAEWIKSQKPDVYCYLKHDEKAPVLAQQLLASL
jgi:uncharacterized protein YecE (DUF72 family)